MNVDFILGRYLPIGVIIATVPYIGKSMKTTTRNKLVMDQDSIDS